MKASDSDTDRSDSRGDADSDSDRELRLDTVLAEHLDAERRGDAPSRDELMARHPELAADLQRFFDGLATIERHGAPAEAAHGARPPPREFGDFEIRDEIGRGGMGTVYRVWQRSLQREVALKTLSAGRLAGATDRDRFAREVAAAARLSHPHIVPIHEVGEVDGVPYFSMELVSGGSLAHELGAGSIDARTGAAWLARVAHAVHYAHTRGVVHRDLKPGNILLDDSRRPMVSDFGLAKLEEGSALTQTGAVLGTPSYMSPEQATGRAQATSPAADVYSLGAILYEILTGRPPFRGATPIETLRLVVESEPVRPRSIAPDVPRDLESIALRCLEKSPRHRYATAEALALDLERFLDGRPVVARRASVLVRSARWVDRNRAPAAIGVLLLVIAVGASIAVVAQRRALRSSYLEQARAFRGIDDPRRRVLGLEAVRKAAGIAPGEDLVDEAVACMALVGLDFEGDVAVTSSTTDCAIDGEARIAAIAEKDGRIRVYELAGKELGPLRHELEPPPDRSVARRLVASVDGRWVAAAYSAEDQGPSDVVRIWRLGVTTPALEARGRGLRYLAVDFSTARDAAGLAEADGRVRIVGGDGSEPTEFRASDGEPSALRFSPDGTRVAICFDVRRVGVYDLASGSLVSTLTSPSGEMYGLAWHPHGEFLATTGGFPIHLWHVGSGTLVRTITGHEGTLVSVAFHPQGHLLASFAWDWTVRVWDPFSGLMLAADRSKYAEALRFSPSGDRLLITANHVLPCRIWSVWSAGERRSLPASGAFDLDPTGRVLLGGDSRSTRLIAVDSGRDLATIPVPFERGLFHPSGDFGIGIHPGGLYFTPVAKSRAKAGEAAGAATTEVWSIGRARKILSNPAAQLGELSLSADGARLAVTVRGAGAVVVDVSAPERLIISARHLGAHRASLGGSGRRLVTAAHLGDPRVHIWDVDKAAHVRAIPTDEASVFAQLSPDDRWLLHFNLRGAHLLDAESGALIWHRADAGGTWSFSSDGTLLALGLDSHALDVLDVASGTRLLTLRGPDHRRIGHILFGPRSERIYVDRMSAGIEVWDLPRIGAGLRDLGLAWALEARTPTLTAVREARAAPLPEAHFEPPDPAMLLEPPAIPYATLWTNAVSPPPR